MLEEIFIKNLGIIDNSHLSFTNGFNVITGETGAGKTMVLSALHLLLGKRIDSRMLKHGENQLSVDGVWDVSSIASKDFIESTGAEIEDDKLFITRTLNKDGKSRAIIGGRNCAAGTLSELSSQLINIHGQSDQIRLKNQNAQRDALDSFNKNKINPLLKEYKNAYSLWLKQKSFLDELKQSFSVKKIELNSIRSFLNDYNELDIVDNELELIEDELLSLSSAEEIISVGKQALDSVSSENYDFISAKTQIDKSIDILSQIESLNSSVSGMLDLGDEISEKLDDYVKQIENFVDNAIANNNSERLEELTERQQSIKSFLKKNGVSIGELNEQKNRLEDRMSELEMFDQPVEDVEKQVELLYANLLKIANKLTNARYEIKTSLETKINKELSGLAMKGSEFLIQMETKEPGNSGQDSIMFMLKQKNSGEKRPIDKYASGGELSRIMLAIEVVLADPTRTPTFVFDEVDSGVGGETAIEIGKRLAILSKEAQVIVVTHLPQVAAFADNHLVVTKTETKESVKTFVEALDKDEVPKELSRMLSGMTDSESGLAHANELIDFAQKEKE